MTVQSFGLGANLARNYIPSGKTTAQELRQRVTTLEAELAHYHAATAAQAKKMMEAQAEARELRKQLRLGGRYTRIVWRANGDALELLKLYYSGLPTTRRNAQELLFMTTRRWNWAKALSRLAQIHGKWEYNIESVDEQIFVNFVKSPFAHVRRGFLQN